MTYLTQFDGALGAAANAARDALAGCPNIRSVLDAAEFMLGKDLLDETLMIEGLGAIGPLMGIIDQRIVEEARSLPEPEAIAALKALETILNGSNLASIQK